MRELCGASSGAISGRRGSRRLIPSTGDDRDWQRGSCRVTWLSGNFAAFNQAGMTAMGVPHRVVSGLPGLAFALVVAAVASLAPNIAKQKTAYGISPLQLNDAPGQILDEVKTGVLDHD